MVRIRRHKLLRSIRDQYMKSIDGSPGSWRAANHTLSSDDRPTTARHRHQMAVAVHRRQCRASRANSAAVAPGRVTEHGEEYPAQALLDPQEARTR
jgi:hypothetical protein